MKIQLKRSRFLEQGVAKRPTAEQTEYGELCVNYNASDPTLFIKDTNDQIIPVAGRSYIIELIRDNSQINITPNEPPPSFIGELWLDMGECPPQLKVWTDCQTPDGEWLPIAGGLDPDPLTFVVNIVDDGDNKPGNVLEARVEELFGGIKPVVTGYQWKTGSTNLSTDKFYTITPADVGRLLECEATVTDSDGTTLSATGIYNKVPEPSGVVAQPSVLGPDDGAGDNTRAYPTSAKITAFNAATGELTLEDDTNLSEFSIGQPVYMTTATPKGSGTEEPNHPEITIISNTIKNVDASSQFPDILLTFEGTSANDNPNINYFKRDDAVAEDILLANPQFTSTYCTDGTHAIQTGGPRAENCSGSNGVNRQATFDGGGNGWRLNPTAVNVTQAYQTITFRNCNLKGQIIELKMGTTQSKGLSCQINGIGVSPISNINGVVKFDLGSKQQINTINCTYNFSQVEQTVYGIRNIYFDGVHIRNGADIKTFASIKNLLPSSNQMIVDGGSWQGSDGSSTGEAPYNTIVSTGTYQASGRINNIVGNVVQLNNITGRWIADNNEGIEFCLAGPSKVNSPLITTDIVLVSTPFKTVPTNDDGSNIDTLKEITWALLAEGESEYTTLSAGTSISFQPPPNTFKINTNYKVTVTHEGEQLGFSQAAGVVEFSTGATRSVTEVQDLKIAELLQRIQALENDGY